MNTVRILLMGIVSAVLLGLQPSARAQQPVDLEAGFLLPPPPARPHTWWHWMNGNVSKEGITLDLEAMKRLGIGGFQLFQVGSNIPKGPVPYGTPENTQLVRWAASEADRLGLSFTLHNCPGWSSSGGPWITPELSMQVLVMTEMTVDGGQRVTVALPQPTATRDYYRDAFVIAYPTPADPTARIADWNSKAGFPGGRGGRGGVGAALITAATADTAAIDPGSVVDISQFMDPRGQLTWDVPTGKWTVLRIGHTTTGAQNRPPPDGGAGLECDKFSREAIEFHFNHFFSEVLEAMKPLAAKGMAAGLIDSYETGLQNWTAGFPQEFKKAMGYDIRNYMPAVFGRVVRSLDASERFLWDFRKVQADLMAQNYYGRFTELCHERGMLSFNEPYDPGNFDEMAVGRFADMPMGEFWQGRENHHSIKLAASVAHINGRAVVGAESFTSQSRWTEYPYSLKALGDFMYTQGLNHYIFHRFAMQPHPTALPGMTMGPWGGHFDRTNTWFQHGAEGWLQYVARCQFLLQRGKFKADLLYFTGEDSPQRTPERGALNPPMPAGYDYDTIDAGSILTRVKISSGRIELPDGASYRVMVLPEKKTMTIELARKIHDLVQQGMTLIVPAKAPDGTPGLKGFPADNDELKRVVAQIWAPGDRVFVGQTPADVLAKINIKPDFESTSRSGTALINYIHRQVGETDLYFVANRKEQQSEELVCTFNVSGKRPEFWDAVKGTITPATVYDFVDGRTRMPIQLDASGSVFVVFRNPAPTQRLQMVARDGATLASVEPLAIGTPAPPARGATGARGLQQAMPMPGASDPLPLALTGGPRGEMLAFANGDYSVRDNRGQTSTERVSGIADPIEITGAWRVTFPPNLGAPAEATFDKLMSWADSSDNGVKYFSGTAVYMKRFPIPAEAIAGGKRVFLDLGKVQVLAEVILNGKNLGILWASPFRVDITDAARSGDNDLELRVTNLWPNRLIGDEQLPAENEYGGRGGRGPTTAPATGRGNTGAIVGIPDWYAQGLPKPPTNRTTFTTWRHWTADDALLESGLIGPVRLRTAVILPAQR